ncbi:MAG: hypothetical protein DWQ36_16380 [Acidobacteria bacterium]|nr:MAG: hypothetical protein DWQ30_16450 [Acidobacteriota bacterium]REK05381.1 MAG: hypothetical protein DWQ36_16380 [Acidobacteriota bacterium]
MSDSERNEENGARPGRMAGGRFLLALLGAGAAGAAGGLVAWGLDQASTRALAGFWVPTGPRLLAWYPGVGAACGATVGTLSMLFAPRAGREATAEDEGTSRHHRALSVFAWSLLLVYLLPVLERAELVGLRIGGPAVGIAGAAVALVGFGLWALVLRAVGGAVCGPLLAAVAVCAGLVANRTVVASPFAPAALLLDAALCAAALLAAYASRSRGGRIALATAGALLLTASAGLHLVRRGASPETVHDPAPDVLLLVVDTLRADVFEEVLRSSPEGEAFRRAFGPASRFPSTVAAAPWTAPSMASIHTGLYPREHGLVRSSRHRDLAAFTHLSQEVPTLAEGMARAGWDTAAVVANPVLHRDSGIARGFEHYEVLAGPTVKLPLLTALARLRLVTPRFYQPAPRVRAALRSYLDARRSDRPLFLWLHWMDPHDPLFEHDLPDSPADGGAEATALQRLYRREVRFVLAEMARTIELLDERGLWRDAVVVLVSDHGEMLPSDGRDKRLYGKLYGHGHALYDELVRVPLLIRTPETTADAERAQLVHHTDLHDTILDLAGVPETAVPRIGRDRVSLASRLRTSSAGIEEPARQRRLALSEATHRGPAQRALRTAEWKLIDHLEGDARDELYAVGEDPEEVSDLSASETEMLAALRRRLDELWNGLDDPPFTSDAVLDPATRRQLEALGYL